MDNSGKFSVLCKKDISDNTKDLQKYQHSAAQPFLNNDENIFIDLQELTSYYKRQATEDDIQEASKKIADCYTYFLERRKKTRTVSTKFEETRESTQSNINIRVLLDIIQSQKGTIDCLVEKVNTSHILLEQQFKFLQEQIQQEKENNKQLQKTLLDNYSQLFSILNKKIMDP